ncbi:MAG: prepilin-type N-terminal cleavage/methylation domain-containing protein [bacterium]|nr:prepilin-type N-terminal cleavage/methylation domain-containing protein [bacterium]
MKRGFSLIELLMVIAIIALIATVAIYNYSQGITRSKVSRAMAELRLIKTSPLSLTKIPDADPWGNPYQYNPQTGIDYSYGPDEQDDAGLVLYDPTNGVKSRGDIYLP